MTAISMLQLIAWIFVIFWAIWFSYVQTERLNMEIFQKMKASVLLQLKESRGVLRIIGLIIYSPYVTPIRAAFFWLVVAILMFLLNGRSE